jgi:methylenetetrahydrofolate dehydrogenase (NADP+)/methenyltetrahydrofolate cyclohydrolase/formyltetrahydrofolate synthetase
MNLHGCPAVVAINRFSGDSEAEVEAVKAYALANGAVAAVTATHFGAGGAGAVELGKAVAEACEDPVTFRHLYPLEMGIEDKIETIVRKVYGGAGISMSDGVRAKVRSYTAQGLAGLPVCMSKTQYSFSHDPSLKNAPTGFTVPIKDIYVSAGAGFLVASLGDISFMPGLPTKPAYCKSTIILTARPLYS